MIDFSKRKNLQFPVTLPKSNTQNVPEMMAASFSNHHLAIAVPQIPEDLESLNDDNLLKNLDDKTVGFPVSHGWCWLAVAFEWWKNGWFLVGEWVVFLGQSCQKGSKSGIVVPCKNSVGVVC